MTLLDRLSRWSRDFATAQAKGWVPRRGVHHHGPVCVVVVESTKILWRCLLPRAHVGQHQNRVENEKIGCGTTMEAR